MRFDELNEDNYMMFAIKHYENPQAVTQEDFYEDLKKFKYIKRLLKRYQKSGELKSHLLLNHFICLYNVFDDAATNADDVLSVGAQTIALNSGTIKDASGTASDASLVISSAQGTAAGSVTVTA